MKLLSWNIRGLNGCSKQRMLKMKIQKDPPYILFLQETKCPSESASAIMTRIWKNCTTIAIDSQGASGDLSISWNPHIISLDYAVAARHSISASFHILGSSIKGYLMNVYGPQIARKKKSAKAY